MSVRKSSPFRRLRRKRPAEGDAGLPASTPGIFPALRLTLRCLTPKERRTFYLLAVLGVVAAGLEAIGLGSMLPFLQTVSDPSSIQSNGLLRQVHGALGFTTDAAFIIALAIGLFVIVAVAQLSLTLYGWLARRFIWAAAHNLACRLLAGYGRMDYLSYAQRSSSELTRNVVIETDRFAERGLKQALDMVNRGVITLAILGVLLAIEPLLTLVLTASVGVPYLLLSMLVRRWLAERGQETIESNSIRVKSVTELFGAFKEIKLANLAGHFINRFIPASSTFTRNTRNQYALAELPGNVMYSMAFGGIVLTLALMLATGREIGAIIPTIGFLAYAGTRLNASFRGLYSAVTTLRYHQSLAELLWRQVEGGSQGASNEDAAAGAERRAALPFESVVELDDVSFNYPGDRSWNISGLSLRVPKYSSTALVGYSGAGKSTTLDLIMGLLLPSAGRMCVDGVEIGEHNVLSWQARVGYVPQDIYLLDDSIRRNIAFGVSDERIDEEAVIAGSKMAHLHGFVVDELPQGYDTIVGDRGVRLSGGQRQRVGIARALYRDPDVLILDEATSDIDNITEAYITEAIRQLSRKKTLIIVAHRLTSITQCDQICIMGEGGVVAAGTYDELLVKSAEFRNLVEGNRDAIEIDA